MTDARDPNLPRPFAGETRRGRPLFELGPIGPWLARVAITPLELTRGTQFELRAEWTGPPAIGFPPSNGPVLAVETWVDPDERLVRAVAIDAATDLRDGRVPDVREHAKRHRERAAV